MVTVKKKLAKEMQPAGSEFITSRRLRIAGNFEIGPIYIKSVLPGDEAVHFTPVTPEGEFISRSGIYVTFELATHYIWSIDAESNEAVPYTIRLSPEDRQFIKDSIAMYLRRQPPTLASGGIPPHQREF